MLAASHTQEFTDVLYPERIAYGNGGVAILALGRGVDLNEHGRFRVTVAVSADAAASASVGLEVEFLDLGAFATDDGLAADALNCDTGASTITQAWPSCARTSG